jgi:membrane fusion protein (multidrug efflux system)
MSDSTSENKASGKKWMIITVNGILVISLSAAVIWGILTYFHLGNDLYTNDAQIEEYINPVNTRIPGYIKDVRFQEHQYVKKGDTLIIIDDREYKIQLEQAEAAYLSALASKNVTSYAVNTVHSNLSVSDANIGAARARLWNAQQNLHRFENLLKDGAATQQQFDQVKTDYDALLAQINALVQQKHTTSLSTEETSERINVNDAEIKRAHAAVAMAKLNLSYTIITAPYDGITGRRVVQEGQLLQAGQTLLSFVRNGQKWVIANYMETQVSHLHIGQKMRLTIDGLDDKIMMGQIVAISEATGGRYSAIPLDNSTGNFIKVQQRIPVRIELLAPKNELSDLKRLRAGMNVEVHADN